METIAAVLLGLVTGSGASKTNPKVDGGVVLNAVSGGLGGLLGGNFLGPEFAEALSGSDLAGSGAGGAVGGIVLSLIVGFLRNKFAPQDKSK